MELNAIYEILPHGITKRNDKLFAVFKVLVTIQQINKPKARTNFTPAELKEDWKALADKVNKTMWYYKLEKKQEKQYQCSFLSKSEEGRTKLKYIAKDLATREISEIDEFRFGECLKRNNWDNAFEFLESDKFFFPEEDVSGDKPIKQFEKIDATTTKGLALDTHDPYTPILKSNDAFATSKSHIIKYDVSEVGCDFRAILASIMDEPIVSEIRFGLARELHIPVVELEIEEDYVYAISIPEQEQEQDLSLPDFRFVKRNINGVVRYYNGLKKMFFNKSDFSDVKIEWADPYKSLLNKSQMHPDGIYLIGVYNESANPDGSNTTVIVDPFDTNAVKGFNALISDGKQLNSLTMHSKEFVFPDGARVKVNKDSGHLNPKSGADTDKSRYRSNVLMAWRGDNLIVNRFTTDAPPANLEPKTDKVKSSADLEFEGEDQYVRRKLFTKEEKLIDRTQAQLLISKKYQIYLRSVSSTHYYVPSEIELGPEDRKHSLCCEDFGADFIPICENDLNDPSRADANHVNFIPIKSPVILGDREYREIGSGTVDQATHLVFDKTKENQEERYVFPPAIKLEDFKILGLMTPDALKRSDERNKISLDSYVYRCGKIEGWYENEIRKTSPYRTPINYLADVRGKSLIILPADISTASMIEPRLLINAFEFDDHYPFYGKARASGVLTEKTGNTNQITFFAQKDKDNVVFKDLPNGIYSFKLYTTDVTSKIPITPIGIRQYNGTSVRISILGKPPRPRFNSNIKLSKAIRYVNPLVANLWFLSIPVESANINWKSVKYLEETTVLKLQHEGIEQLMQVYYPEVSNRPKLLKDEFPYEIFLAKDGSIESGSLRTDLYPGNITITYKVSPEISGSGTFFKIRLNDEDVLEASYGPGGRAGIRLDNTFTQGSDFIIDIKLNQEKKVYQIFLNSDPNVWATLKKYLNPELSVNDMEVREEVLIYKLLDSKCELKFKHSVSCTLVGDLQVPYSSEKKIRLFSSSNFQAYYPSATMEYELGTQGDEVVIAIPNNTVPEPANLELDTLLLHTKDNSWTNPESVNIKRSRTESLLRITLQQDFMKEGKNMLGIIISKEIDDDTATDKNISRIGEDITKLTDTDWSTNSIKDIIDLNNTNAIFKKYHSTNLSRFYKIGVTTYEVLEFVPFYNIKLKKWQVVLPLKFLRQSEVMFAKLVCIKISPGHGLTTLNNKPEVTKQNPLTDPTGTNISLFSEPAQLPIYTAKVINVEKTSTSNQLEYTVRVDSFSKYPGKIYFVMLKKNENSWGLINFHSPSSEEKFPTLTEFASLVPGGNLNKTGKILYFKGNFPIKITRETCTSILVMEFEIHNNKDSDLKFENEPAFVEYNPLFDSKGLKLINIAEFFE